MTVNEIKAELETILSSSRWWKRFIGSQFLSYLVLFLAQLTKRTMQAAERNLQESFLSLATKRTSILAGAEDKGYVCRKISPSRGIVTIENISAERVDIPQYSPLVSSTQLQYMVMNSETLYPGESKELDIQQIERSYQTVIAEQDREWYSVVLSTDQTLVTHKIIVRVNGALWFNQFKFRNANENSEVYTEYYKSTDQLGIRFGNGVTGKAIEKGDKIELEIWSTAGESTLIDGQKLSFINHFESMNKQVTVTTKTAILGGDEAEDLESIRNAALYASNYDDQLVWDGDFKSYISTNVAGITFLEIWGEKGQEKLDGHRNVLNVNTIFICVYSATKGDLIYDEILDLFDGREGYNERYAIAPRLDTPFTVTVTGNSLPNFDPQETSKAVLRHLDSKFGQKVADKPAITTNLIWSEIQTLVAQYGIGSFEVEITGLDDVTPTNVYRYLDTANSTSIFNFV